MLTDVINTLLDVWRYHKQVASTAVCSFESLDKKSVNAPKVLQIFTKKKVHEKNADRGQTCSVQGRGI